MARATDSICLAIAAAATALSGCVERTITITSEPAGALVYLNDREIGRTPVDVEFIHYGTYDVRLIKEGYEPLLTAADAETPFWDLPGPDLIAELTPVTLRSEIDWHFVLEPADADRESLIDRAREARQQSIEAQAGESDPDVEPAEQSATAPAAPADSVDS